MNTWFRFRIVCFERFMGIIDMILEIAVLQIKLDEEEQFENIFLEASQSLMSAKSYINHHLYRSVDLHGNYSLHVNWESRSHHMDEFRESAYYQRWSELLRPFFKIAPQVEHYEQIFESR